MTLTHTEIWIPKVLQLLIVTYKTLLNLQGTIIVDIYFKSIILWTPGWIKENVKASLTLDAIGFIERNPYWTVDYMLN